MKSINPLILFTALILNRCTIIGLTGGILIDKTQHYELDHPKYDQVQLESKVPIVLTDYSDESKNGRFSKAVLLPDSSYNRIFSAAASKNDSLKMLFCLQDTILINGQLHLLSGYEYSAIRTIRISDQDSVYMDLENFEFFVEGKGDTIKAEYLKNLMQTGKVPYNWSLFYHGKNC